MNTCYFCKREPGTAQCGTCKRTVCIQCQDNHNCYAREGRADQSVVTVLSMQSITCSNASSTITGWRRERL